MTDSTSARPLGGVLVALTGGARATRTDVAGQYVIAVPRTGDVVLEVRRIGYAARRIPITVADGGEKVEMDIRLVRVAQLDTVRVRAADRAVYGLVGDAAQLTPVGGAVVELLGAGKSTLTDSHGRFFIPFKSGTTFMVRAKSKGYAPQTMSITVPPNEGLEISLLLDSANGAYPRRLEMALAEFDTRIRWAGVTSSALVPRHELVKLPGTLMLHAIRSSPSFGKRSLRFLDSACVFVDGVPRPMLSLDSYDPREVEFIEAYTRWSEAGREFARAWPPRLPCGSTGAPRAGKSPGKLDDVAWWVVIWLKR